MIPQNDNNKHATQIVSLPEQREGAHYDCMSVRKMNDLPEAEKAYQDAKERLLAVNEWHNIMGTAAAAVFYLCDRHGNEVDRVPVRGDYFKIDIPGPGPVSGDGFDWVRIEKIEEIKKRESEWIIIQVRPAPSPLNDKEDVAHFFDSDATSTFIITRENNLVYATIHGRNEKTNNADQPIDNLRNKVVSKLAAAGLSSIQWKRLCTAFLEQPENQAS